MYQHERVNRIIGWSLGAFALIIYLLTTAPTVAFWDNGEFIAVGATLGVGHPPGSPVYTLVSRLFSLLPFPNEARAVNFMSILAGALAIAFLYFAMAKMARRWERKITSFADGIPTYVTGITACLFAAFSFSFWENALEAEVYATNIFLMTLTLWMVVRWSELKEIPRDRRYLYLVIYILGLGVGIHLGCLLWAPAYLLFVAFFESNFAGVVLLGLPLALGFVLLSKDLSRGAIGIFILWLATTVFYSLPAIWPKPAREQRYKRKRGAPERHPAVLPPWLWGSLLLVEVVALIAVASASGAPGVGWFLAMLSLSAASLYLFVHLMKLRVIDRPEIPARVILSVVVLGALAMSVHAYLLIRARLKPAIDESNPTTWSLVLDVMRRKQYEPMRFFPRRTPFGNQFRILWSYIKPQFTVWPLILSAWGAIAHARKDRRTFFMMATGFALASVGLLFYLNLSDHEVRTREYFWVPAYVGLAFWMGTGAGSIVEWGRRIGRRYRNILAVALVAFSLLPLVRQYHTMDRSKNYVAYYYGWNIIEFLEPNALLVTNGDNDTFPLWYLQQVEHVRPDVDIVNLSLIQINWYIQQLKERGVPMSFTDQEIEAMHPYWVRDPETGAPRVITLKDIAFHDIIRETGDTRPIYFAVTVDDFMGYYDYLRLEGMVFRLTTTKERHQVDVEKTRKNCFENYRYDSIVDVAHDWRVMDEIYKDPTQTRLITNYAAGFSRLGYASMQQDPPDVDEAIRLYGIALKFAPDYAPALNGLIAVYAANLLQPDRALPLAERLVRVQPENGEAWIRYGGVNLMIAERLDRQGQEDDALKHYEAARDGYERALGRVPERAEIYPALLSIYQRLGLQAKIDNVIDLWQRYAPEDFQRSVRAYRKE